MTIICPEQDQVNTNHIAAYRNICTCRRFLSNTHVEESSY